MWKYFFKRLGLAVITFFIIIFIVYMLQASFGNNPFAEDALNAKGSGKGTAELIDRAAINGLNRPSIVRFFNWFWDFFFRFDSGVIYSDTSDYKHNIPKLFFEPLKWTILVSLPAFILSVIIGTTLGVVAAYNRGKWVDSAITTFVTIFIALPSFVIAHLIVLVTSSLGLPFEFRDPRDASGLLTALSLVTPVIVFTLSSLAGYTIFVRNQVVSVLTSNQVLIAKAKGLTKFEIFRKHVLRNSLVILVGILIFSYIGLLSGSIILEKFFRIPGSSTIIVAYTQKGEINVIMFSLVFFTALSLVTLIIVDMSYAWMDPRIKIASTSQSKNYFGLFKKHLNRNKQFKSQLQQSKKIKGDSNGTE
ncbi:ABC transporter permease [Mycoplasma procyoni]|uniref:ABC transporter permease n=1 Tax=Mycoplasma procyoni TaxID=568784 RepID=UPI00197BD6FC|nr:ABC transporter permease [Mycoplasma procyoni]MBN3535099.1 ABC transporter permease [Mycoplasma procyoni]